MSRVGRQPIVVPAGVDIAINGRQVQVSGPQGKLSFEHRPEITVRYDADSKSIVVERTSEEREARALHGLTRALVQNMVRGVKDKYEKRLEIVGVGYVASIAGGELRLRVGYANEIRRKIPAGLEVTCPDQTHVVIRGCDKQQVGQFAAAVRSLRKPEPYKGKGVRYAGEQIKLKPGKAASK